MEFTTLTATVRGEQGKNAVRRVRATGGIPAVLYGGGDGQPVSLTIDGKALQTLLHDAGEHAVVQIEIADHPELNTPSLVKAVQRHPVHDSLAHADFMRIDLDQRIQTVVPIALTGRAAGIVEGGIMEHHLREIEIECLALNIPETVEIDVTSWEIGTTYHVSDLQTFDDISIITDPGRVIAALHAPRVVEEATTDLEEGEGVEGEGEEGEGEGEGEKGEGEAPASA